MGKMYEPNHLIESKKALKFIMTLTRRKWSHFIDISDAISLILILSCTGNSGKPSCLQLAVVLPDIFLIGVQIPSQRIYYLIFGHLNPTKSNSKMANLARIVAVNSPKNTIIAMWNRPAVAAMQVILKFVLFNVSQS